MQGRKCSNASAACAAACLCLVSLASCGNPAAVPAANAAATTQPVAVHAKSPPARNVRRDPSSVEQVLWEDRMLSLQFQQLRRALGAASSTNWLVAQMRAIDTSRCPTGFRTAYLRHCHAWQDMAEQLRVDNREIAERALTFALKIGVLNSPDFSLLHLPEGHRRCAEAIEGTWKEVEVAAVEAGAQLPR